MLSTKKTLGLTLAALTATAPTAASATTIQNASSPAGSNAVYRIAAPTSAQGFNTCAARPNEKVATSSNLGSRYGSGITEVLTKAQVSQINTALTQTKRSALASNTSALRYLDSGAFIELDAKGNKIGTLSNAPGAVVPLSLQSEIKKVVGACLGVGATGGATWASIGEKYLAQLTTWKTAVKFVVRRIGVFAAVSCMGGIVWSYI